MDGPVIKGDTICIPSDQEHLVAVDEFLEGTLRGFAVDESLIADIAISVTEIVNNAIIHGNKKDPAKEVSLRIQNDSGKLQFTITDEGAGFDPKDIPDPLKEENLMREVGRGVFIVKSLMDNITVENTGKGSIVVMTKTLAVISIEYIKALFKRITHRTGISQPPLAERAADITGILQHFRKQYHIGRNRVLAFRLYFLIAAHKGMSGMLARHQRRARRRAYRTAGIVIREK